MLISNIFEILMHEINILVTTRLVNEFIWNTDVLYSKLNLFRIITTVHKLWLWPLLCFYLFVVTIVLNMLIFSRNETYFIFIYFASDENFYFHHWQMREFIWNIDIHNFCIKTNMNELHIHIWDIIFRIIFFFNNKYVEYIIHIEENNEK